MVMTWWMTSTGRRISFRMNEQKSPSGTFLPKGLTQEVLNVEGICSRQSPHDQLLCVYKHIPQKEENLYPVGGVMSPIRGMLNGPMQLALMSNNP